MPTYVYTCDTCEANFEQFQSFKDEPLRSCPRCHHETVRRVFQPVGIVFKGSGWYITDSRGSNSSTLQNNQTSSSETSNSTTETAKTKTESTASDTAPSKESTTSTTSTTSSETPSG